MLDTLLRAGGYMSKAVLDAVRNRLSAARAVSDIDRRSISGSAFVAGPEGCCIQRGLAFGIDRIGERQQRRDAAAAAAVDRSRLQHRFGRALVFSLDQIDWAKSQLTWSISPVKRHSPETCSNNSSVRDAKLARRKVRLLLRIWTCGRVPNCRRGKPHNSCRLSVAVLETQHQRGKVRLIVFSV